VAMAETPLMCMKSSTGQAGLVEGFCLSRLFLGDTSGGCIYPEVCRCNRLLIMLKIGHTK